MATPLKVKTLSDKATFPSRESCSAGYDLYSATETKVPARGIALILTDLIIAIPEGLYGLIALRSALTWNPLICIREAVFDADYRDPVMIQLHNHSDEDFEVKVGDQIALLILKEICFLELSVVEPSPNRPHLTVKMLSEKAAFPSRASARSPGYELWSTKETKVPARGEALIPTDLSIAIPKGFYGWIAPRSGLAWNPWIEICKAVIDAECRDPVMIKLRNHSNEDFEVKVGDRIAQLILEKPYFYEVSKVEDLDAA